jgi:uncharacterized protein YabE (DUF348 family)
MIALAVPISRGPARGEPTTASVADGSRLNLAAARVAYPGSISFTVHADGLSTSQITSGATVGQGLASLGVRIGENDLVEPSPDVRLLPGMHVYVTHAKSVRIIFGSEGRLVYTRAGTVREFLREVGIEPQEGDRTFPKLDDPIRKGMTVSFVTFRDGVDFTEELIGYATVYEDDPEMLDGERRVVAAGVEGIVRREYKITRLNGVEVGRELVSEVRFPASDEVIAVGTRAPSAPAPSSSGPVVTFEGLNCVETMNVYATSYTAASAGGSGVTATGTGVYRGIIAVDPRVIPLGTQMWIPGYGYGIAADTGGGVVGAFIDLGYGPDDVVDWQSQYVDICILG